MKDITVLLYWTNMREITSYWFDVLREITSHWFDVQKCTNFKQLFCATCRFPQLFDLHAVSCRNNELFLVPWNKTLKYLNYFLLGFYSTYNSITWTASTNILPSCHLSAPFNYCIPIRETKWFFLQMSKQNTQTSQIRKFRCLQ